MEAGKWTVFLLVIIWIKYKIFLFEWTSWLLGRLPPGHNTCTIHTLKKAECKLYTYAIILIVIVLLIVDSRLQQRKTDFGEQNVFLSLHSFQLPALSNIIFRVSLGKV